jgi:site-specific recombinase XerD
MERIITENHLEQFHTYLREDEKSLATIEKYMRDLDKLAAYADGREITKSLMLNYKEKLRVEDGYKISSINSYIVVANRFLEFMGWYDLRIKTYKMQKETFYPEQRYLSKAEYKRLLKTAKEQKKIRLYLMIETLAATGMRVSELQYVTVSAVAHGSVRIYNKGKSRTVLLPKQLQKQLQIYITKEQIKDGIVFRTSHGKCVNRSNIWRALKALCESAGVSPDKGFPHNLRRLFARSFYGVQKDLVKLASILGHTSVTTTQIYLNETSRELRKQLEKLDLVGFLW